MKNASIRGCFLLLTVIAISSRTAMAMDEETASSINDLKKQVQSLMEQVSKLQSQVSSTNQTAPKTPSATQNHPNSISPASSGAVGDMNEAMRPLMEQPMHVMVRAEHGGSGKSYACEAMLSRGHQVLFVCPTSKLASKYGANGGTVNCFFGVGLPEDTRMAKLDDGNQGPDAYDQNRGVHVGHRQGA
jgi:hypothetical protein